MQVYIAKRLLSMLPVLLLVATFVFFIVQLMPGSVIEYMFGGVAGEEGGLPPIGAEHIREELGLDLPMHVQYWNWLRRAARLDFGDSMLTREPVIQRIIDRFPRTLLLMGTALVLSIIVAIPIGVISALKQYSVLDHVVTGTSFLAISIPSFFVGLGAVYIFSSLLRWTPVGGMAPVGTTSPPLLVRMHYMILPVLVVSLRQAASFARYLRSGMLEVISKQYVSTARSKGLSEYVVVLKHALPNALIPLITIIGIRLPVIFGGSVVIERIFSWPGIGSLTLNALQQRDLTMVVGINMFFALFVLFANLLADISYALVDPRIRYG